MFYQRKKGVIFFIEEKILMYKVTVIHLMLQVTLHFQVMKHADDHQLTLFA